MGTYIRLPRCGQGQPRSFSLTPAIRANMRVFQNCCILMRLLVATQERNAAPRRINLLLSFLCFISRLFAVPCQYRQESLSRDREDLTSYSVSALRSLEVALLSPTLLEKSTWSSVHEALLRRLLAYYDRYVTFTYDFRSYPILLVIDVLPAQSRLYSMLPISYVVTILIQISIASFLKVYILNLSTPGPTTISTLET